MKKYYSFYLVILIILFSGNTYCMTLEQLQNQFNQHTIIRADYTQERYIQGVTKPLKSNGKLIVSKQLGLIWQQLSPFLMTLKINENRMEQQIANQSPQIITAKVQPQLFEFTSLILAMFDADKKTLDQNFNYVLTQQNKQWLLMLTPKTAPLNKLFNQIKLTGYDYLSELVIDDKQNDKTIITFTNHNTEPLTLDEKQLFN